MLAPDPWIPSIWKYSQRRENQKALRCRHCGEVVADAEAARPVEASVVARHVAARALCPECGDDEIEEVLQREAFVQGVSKVGQPAPARCPVCGREDSFRPLRAPEQRTYEACGGDGYPADVCARVVMVRYEI